MRALSVRQPWAWLILHGGKDIENRSWETMFRGQVLLHAGKTLTKAYHREVSHWAEGEFGIIVPELDDMPRGGVVGVVTIAGCVRESASRWFNRDCFGLVLRDAEPVPFYPCNGMLGFFDVPRTVQQLRGMTA